MHNYLLRYFLAEGGVHPDQDVQIRVVPPPEMVANLKAENVDGYLAPDPFNQRAVYENTGFIYKFALSTALQKMDIHNKLLFLGRLCKSLVIGKNRAIMRPSMR